MVFARDVQPGLTSLVKKLDAAVAANGEAMLFSFVVFLKDDEKLPERLKAYADKENIKDVILAQDNVVGPPGYNIPKDADVTVILYNERKVEANFAFRKGELNAAAVTNILAQLPKILPK